MWKEAASWSVAPAKLYTIGHSTRTLDDFIALLKREGVSHLVDVRAFPTSARYPHFNQSSLAEAHRLLALQEETQADELMILTITGDYESRRESYRLLAEAFGHLPSGR